jgi:hypothetical protein
MNMLLFFILFTFLLTLFLLGTFLVAWLLRIQVLEVGLFTGTRFLSFKAKGIKFALNLIPLGSYIKFNGEDSEADPVAEVPHGWTLLRDRHPLIRVVLLLAGPLSVLLPAVVFLGMDATVDAIVRSYYYFVETMKSSLAGALIVKKYFLLQESSPLQAAGRLSALMSAMQLVPFPLLNGFLIIQTLITWKRKPGPVWTHFQWLGILVALVIMIRVVGAFWTYWRMGAA